MSQGYYTWSRTPASNATADSSIGWSEGQAPSSVNDSARAMMARTAEYRDDIAGAIVTTGSSTAYAVTTYEVFDTLPHLNGQMIAFTPHVTNGAGPVTLAVDGVGAKALRTSPNVELLAGMLIQGTPYVATFNNSDAAWYLQSFYGNPYNIPLGGFLAYGGLTAPNSSFVFPYGQAISRTTYATLFSLFSTTYGAGDGTTTFNIPDLRGRAIFGGDSMGGSAASRLTLANSGINAANVSASGGSPNVTVAQNQLPNVAPTFTGTAGAVSVSSVASVEPQLKAISAGGVTVYVSGTATLPSTGVFTPVGTVSSINGGVTQQSLITMPPAYILNFILRVI